MPAMVSEESSLRGLLVYFLRLGTLGFGGPIALASRMNKDLVEQRRSLGAHPASAAGVQRVALDARDFPGLLVDIDE